MRWRVRVQEGVRATQAWLHRYLLRLRWPYLDLAMLSLIAGGMLLALAFPAHSSPSRAFSYSIQGEQPARRSAAQMLAVPAGDFAPEAARAGGSVCDLIKDSNLKRQCESELTAECARSGNSSFCSGPCSKVATTDIQQCLEGVFDQNTYHNSQHLQNPITPNSALFFYTPYNITVDSIQVQALWGAAMGIVDIFVIAVLALEGARIILAGTVFRYADAVERLPGILLALIAAHLSLAFITFFLGLNNIMTGTLYNWADQNLQVSTLFQLVPGDLNFTNFFQELSSTGFIEITIRIMALMLLGQMIVRLLFIGLYIIISPIGIACWALPGKVGQPLTRMWMQGFISTVLIQFLMVVAYIITQVVLVAVFNFVKSGVQNSLSTATLIEIMHVACLWFILRIPVLLGTAPLRSMMEVGRTMTEVVGSAVMLQIEQRQALVSLGLGGAQTGIAGISLLRRH